MKPGDKVSFIPFKDAPEDHWQKGIVKSISDENHLFVVYHCGGEWEDSWDNYMNYTAARTEIGMLKPGWPMKSDEVIEIINELT